MIVKTIHIDFKLNLMFLSTLSETFRCVKRCDEKLR